MKSTLDLVPHSCSLLIITLEMDTFTIVSVVFTLELLDRCTKSWIFSPENCRTLARASYTENRFSLSPDKSFNGKSFHPKE